MEPDSPVPVLWFWSVVLSQSKWCCTVIKSAATDIPQVAQQVVQQIGKSTTVFGLADWLDASKS